MCAASTTRLHSPTRRFSVHQRLTQLSQQISLFLRVWLFVMPFLNFTYIAFVKSSMFFLWVRMTGCVKKIPELVCKNRVWICTAGRGLLSKSSGLWRNDSSLDLPRTTCNFCIWNYWQRLNFLLHSKASIAFQRHLSVYLCVLCVDKIRYFFKYICKNNDGETILLACGQQHHNENDRFREAKYVSAFKALWRVFQLKTTDKNPVVVQLDDHLESHHSIHLLQKADRPSCKPIERRHKAS